MSNSKIDAPLSSSILDLLESAGEPEAEDPKLWTPPEVVGLALLYAYGVDALPQRDNPGWQGLVWLCDDILFNRDLLQDWLDEFGEEELEALIESEIPDLPLPSEADERLEAYYQEDGDIRKFIEKEYAQFREDISPPRHARWWWLDAELFGKRIH